MAAAPGAPTPTAAAGGMRPNLLFIMMDQLPAWALGCYGDPVVQTPHLDSLAASGVRFERYFVQQALRVPSRCSLFTGRYVHAHRHRGNDSLLRPDEHHLGSLLRGAGYRTAYCGKNHLIPDERGPQDFHYWRGSPNEQMARLAERAAAAPGPEEHPAPPAPTRANPWPTAYYAGRRLGDRGRADAVRADDALAFLDSVAPDAETPFALTLSFTGPHPPYAAPESHYGRHPRSSVPVPPAPRFSVEGKPPWVAAFRRFYRYDEMAESDVQEIVGTFYDHVAFLDEQVGRVLDRLEQRGLREKTLVLFTADHGDYAARFGLFEKHAFDFYDTLLNVPLILSWPGHVSAGQTRADLMESVDVLPTLLDYCGVPLPESVQGTSFRATVQGERPGPRDAVFAEACGDAGNVPIGGLYWHRLRAIEPFQPTWPGKMVRTADWKLCWRSHTTTELYDLRRDPLEHTNVAGRPEHQATQRALEQRLLAWTALTEDHTP